MLLTKEERQKFSTYLKQSAEGDKGIIEQLIKLNNELGMSPALTEAMTGRMKSEMTAKLTVALMLDKIEDF
jgi:hypothetical protein